MNESTENGPPTDIYAVIARARQDEDRYAGMLVRACMGLIQVQQLVQLEQAGTLNTAMQAAVELEVQVRLGRSAQVRIVTLDGEGTEKTLLRAFGVAVSEQRAH